MSTRLSRSPMRAATGAIGLAVFAFLFAPQPSRAADPRALGGPPIVASVPQSIPFQGFLTDAGGAPLTGTVSLRLSIYNTASGGTALWTETQPAVGVSQGVFEVGMPATGAFPPGVFDAAPRYLGVQVNGEAELPRTQLRSTPFAFRAQSADTTTSSIRLRDGAVTVLESEDVGPGRRLHFRNMGDRSAAWIGCEVQGEGAMRLYDGGTNSTVFLTGDNLGGGYMFLDGITPVAFAAGLTGDLSAQMPSSGITDSEIGDEPGVVSANNTNFVALTSSTPQSVISRSIVSPRNGYAIAWGQCAARITHTSGTATSGAVGLSDVATSFGVAQDVNVQISSSAASGTYAIPVHVNGVFAVSGGTVRTIHIVATEVAGDIELEDLSLTILYVPTAYGTVTETLIPPVGIEDRRSVRGPQSPAEIDAERSDSERANLERIEREMTEMQSRLEALRKQVTRAR